jgi:ribonucleotide reductase beta subunit family protein with ferritin-like domain
MFEKKLDDTLIKQSEEDLSDSELLEIEQLIENNVSDNLIDSMISNTKKSESEEILLVETQRYTLHPIRYPDIWKLYEMQVANFWTAGEIDFSKDRSDWNKLNTNEKFFIKHILAFFAGSDGIVGINIMENFTKDVKILEAQMAYMFQAAMETIHSQVYSLMIETYIDNREEKQLLFNAIERIPCIAQKAQWALKWTSNNELFSKRLVAFAIVEGLFFSGAFCSIYWLKERGILPGLTKSNEFIARDEGLHTEFACLLYSKIANKLDQSVIVQMVEEAVNIETEFITQSLPIKLIGMNDVLMTEYIKYIADWLVVKLGYPKIYDVRNPFSFMNTIGMESRSNFFDERTSTYQKAHVFNSSTELEVTDDF